MADVNGDAPQTNGGNHASASPPSQPAPAPTTSAPTAAAPATTSTSSASQPLPLNPAVPQTSLQDAGSSKRPRDARMIHLILSSLGCTAYQERVPLQLLDFAYRHSSSILSDALHLSADAYISQQTRARDAPPGGALREADGQVSANAVQLAIQSRLQYQFGGGTGYNKEFLHEVAMARNKVALPRVLQNEWGVRLPSERFVMTGVPWGLKGEWREEGDGEEDGVGGLGMGGGGDGEGDGMEGLEMGMGEEGVGGEDVEGGTMEDLFGGDADQDMDQEME